MFIIKYKKIFISISAGLVILSAIILSELNAVILPLALGSAIIQPTGEKNYILKTKHLSEEEHSNLLKTLSLGGRAEVEEKSFSSIGPSVGQELARKAVIAIILVSLGIILFIAYAFRKVSKPISSRKYGLIAIATLLHDVAIPVWIFT